MFKKARPFSKLMITALIVIFSTIIFTILGNLINIYLYDVNLFDVNGGNSTDLLFENINALKVLQIFQSIGLFIIPTLIAMALFFDNGFKALGFNKILSAKNVLLTLLLMIVILPFISFIGVLNEQMSLPDFLSKLEEMMRAAEDSAQQMTEKLLKADNLKDLFINIIMIAVIPAIGEEIFFRGLILNLIRKMTSNVHIAIVITGLIFSFFHFQFYGFIPRAFLGILFGYLLIWSGTLWLPIIAHFLNNLFATLGYYFIEKGIAPKEIDQYNLDTPGIILAIVSAILTAIILWSLWKLNLIKTKEINN